MGAGKKKQAARLAEIEARRKWLEQTTEIDNAERRTNLRTARTMNGMLPLLLGMAMLPGNPKKENKND